MRIIEIGWERTNYTLWLSARETEGWANKPGQTWPCSTLAGRRVVVCVDGNGLRDLCVDGGRGDQDIDGDELDACIADHLPTEYRHLWPCWEPKR